MKSVSERYAECLRRWVEQGDEPSLMAEVRSLGSELDEQGVPWASIEEIHAGALRRVGEACPELPLATAAPRIAELMLEIGRAYLVARRRRLRASEDDEGASALADDEFLGLLTHELRTPLGPILTWSEILGSEGMDDQEVGEALGAIARNAQALQGMIDNLSVALRSRTVAQPPVLAEVDLAPIVSEVVDSFRVAAEGKGVLLECLRDESLPVAGEPRALRQILRNLIENAVKFTPAGGRVEVAARRVAGRVQVVVRDTGCGLVAGDLNQIFDQVWPVAGAITRRHRGLGLGLTVVRRLTEMQGGSVLAESGGESEGATFTVAFPLASSEAVEARASGELDRATSGLRTLGSAAGASPSGPPSRGDAVQTESGNGLESSDDGQTESGNGWEAPSGHGGGAEAAGGSEGEPDDGAAGLVSGGKVPPTLSSVSSDAGVTSHTVADPDFLSGVRILVVDDEPDATRAATALLERHGAEVCGIHSAEEALGALENFQPQVLLSDLAMPRHDGYALMVAIRTEEARSGLPRLPAVALTAHSREQERRKAVSAGFDAVVSKPIESSELLSTLELLIAGR